MNSCALCGGDVEPLDSYELIRTYAILKDGLIAAAPDPMTSLHFCSPRCLVAYVAEKIAPDVQGEE
jgi:hypothetical protein